MYLSKTISAFVLAVSIVLGATAPAFADRYDDPSNTRTETIEPTDSSENHAVVLQDFA
ncbi:hypothetical protein N9L49_00510 [Rhodospirillales bacterium]|nr:hypothetical protein [Rhodospirillales bacterium]